MPQRLHCGAEDNHPTIGRPQLGSPATAPGTRTRKRSQIRRRAWPETLRDSSERAAVWCLSGDRQMPKQQRPPLETQEVTFPPVREVPRAGRLWLRRFPLRASVISCRCSCDVRLCLCSNNQSRSRLAASAWITLSSKPLQRQVSGSASLFFPLFGCVVSISSSLTRRVVASPRCLPLLQRPTTSSLLLFRLHSAAVAPLTTGPFKPSLPSGCSSDSPSSIGDDLPICRQPLSASQPQFEV
jgi:hypothetical protein